MAEVLNEGFIFVDRRSKYPWNEWLDGKVRKLIKGTDYENNTTNFVAYLRTVCTKHAMTPQLHVENDYVIFQALPKVHIVNERVVTGTDVSARMVNPVDLLTVADES